MKSKVLYPILCISILMNACAPKKEAAKDPAPKQSASADDSSAIASGSEHCMDKEASACFIEKEENGRSTFYTTKAYQEKWLTNPGIVKANIEMKQVSDEQYQKMLTDGLVPRMSYSNGLDVNLNVLDESGQPTALPGRDANARLPIGGLAKNAGAFKRLSGVMKGGAGKGVFSKIFRKPSVGANGKFSGKFGKMITALVGVLGIGTIAGIGTIVGTEAAKNSKDVKTPIPSQIPVKLSFGNSNVSDEIEVEN